jgi:DNA-directed RNA polymerase specialized sigma24 family protein
MDNGTPSDPERSELARRALSSLTSPERSAYIWNKAGFSHGDIAKHLGISEAAVELLLRDAHRKIRDFMDSAEPT